jgi:polyphosphate kinase
MKNNGYSSKHFINRELSWLEFNKRVLEEAQDSSHPLFERLKFLSIVSSNLDEFFMIRAASLRDQINGNFEKPDPSGLTPKDQIKSISKRTHELIYDQYNCYNYSIKKALKKEHIQILSIKKLDLRQLGFIEDYYLNNIYPVLTPMVVDKNKPFPLVLNKTLNIALLLQDSSKTDNVIFATIQVPSVLERFIEIPPVDNIKTFVLLEDVIKLNLSSLFGSHKVLTSGCYRITRNADLDVDEEEAEDLLTAVEQSLKQRKWGSAIRLEIENDINKSLLRLLEAELELFEEDEYEIPGPLDLTFLMKLSAVRGYEHLRYKPFTPIINSQLTGEEDIFKLILEKDILLHHPYESFDSVVNLVSKAATDPDVLAIKQTLYRVSGDSPIIDALILAAENGKQVTVLFELKARFDELNNITWAKKLETAGCHVIYGLADLKTHCKILLIVRREEGAIKRYVHLGTGNYNDVTAKLYTDIGLLTSNPYFGSDASSIFNMLSGYSRPTNLYKMTLAPINLRSKFLSLIERETKNAKEGKKAKIIIKVNSLVDKEIIETLYKASSSGVVIDLIIRGICCLRPKIPKISEEITVRSIVGRFLEHSRIFYFYNDGAEEIYLASADLMNRNIDRRVELLFPIEDKHARKKVMNILEVYLLDTSKARILNSDGSYSRVDKRGKEIIDSQFEFYKPIIKKSVLKEAAFTDNDFKPIKEFKD